MPLFVTVFLGMSARAEDSWDFALDAYRSQDFDTGHARLRAFVDSSPGDLDLAAKYCERILVECERQRVHDRVEKETNPYAIYAARRLCALERLGALSVHDEALKDAVDIVTRDRLLRGRRLEAVETVARMAAKAPHEPFWRVCEVDLLRRVRSPEVVRRFDELSKALRFAPDDSLVRRRFDELSRSVERERGRPRRIAARHEGKDLLGLLDAEELDDLWKELFARRARDLASEIDRLAAISLGADTGMPWRDATGQIDAARLLELWLEDLPEREVTPLRETQEASCAADRDLETTSDESILRLGRRFVWAPSAHRRLLELARRDLWSGRVHAALRSFDEVLARSIDAETRKTALVGAWTAMVEAGLASTVEDLLGDVESSRRFDWFGEKVEAGEIARRLLASRASPNRTLDSPSLGELLIELLRLPDAASSSPSEVELSVERGDLFFYGPELLARHDPSRAGRPRWMSISSFAARQHRRVRYTPGPLRPCVDGGVLFARIGRRGVPHGIVALDRATGTALWSSERSPGRPRGFRSYVPLGDPVAADGRLFFLQWASRGDAHHRDGRRLSLVCFDPAARRVAWDRTITVAGRSADLERRLHRAEPRVAVWGNRVTVHRGAVYGSSNSGIVARCDVRDGRIDWVHTYPTERRPRRDGAPNRGAAPVIAGRVVIFQPKDTDRIFALDRRSGRLVWENAWVPATQVEGVVDGLLIVRVADGLAALETRTGRASWFRTLRTILPGRALLRGPSIDVATTSRLVRLDARTGRLLDSRELEISDETPRSVAIGERSVWVVTDRPSRPTEPAESPAVSISPNDLSRLEPVWRLPRTAPRVSHPPPGSPLRGHVFVIADEILECVEASEMGTARWRRFCDVSDPTFWFVGTTVVVVNRGETRPADPTRRVVAFDGSSGAVLWESVVARNFAKNVIDTRRTDSTAGSILLFHDGSRKIRALDTSDGRWKWSRDLGPTHHLRWIRDEDRLHAVFWSAVLSLRHISIDLPTGRLLRNEGIEIPSSAGDLAHGRLRKDGYYEVRTPAVFARYVRLVALSEVSNRGWTSIAELQAIGEDGDNLSRDAWRVHYVDSFEPDSSVDERPRSAIDNDPVTWWHTKWKGGVPRHPHEIQIDLGARVRVAGLRYLPANIPSHNGMIRDYEWYVSDDAQDWGTPLAKGQLVRRPHLRSIRVGRGGAVFEAKFHGSPRHEIYHYELATRTTRFVEDTDRVVASAGPWLFTIAKRPGRELLRLCRFDDPAFRFDLGEPKHFDLGRIHVVGERIVFGRSGRVIVDPRSRRIRVASRDSRSFAPPEGFVLLAEGDELLRVVSKSDTDHHVIQRDLVTGRSKLQALFDQAERLKDPFHDFPHGELPRVGEVIVLSDDSSVSGWRVDLSNEE